MPVPLSPSQLPIEAVKGSLRGPLLAVQLTCRGETMALFCSPAAARAERLAPSGREKGRRRAFQYEAT